MSTLRDPYEFQYYSRPVYDSLYWPPLYPKSSCLITAAVHDNVEKLKALLDSPEWYGVTDKNGNTLLHIAVKSKSAYGTKVFKYMSSLDDYPIDAINDDQDTVLRCCFTHRHKEPGYFLKILIRRGADLNLQDSSGETALHNCCRMTLNPELMVEIFAMLLYYGADPSITDNCGNKAFENLVISKSQIISLWSRNYFLIEHLFNFTFDELECPKIDFHVLAVLADMNHPLFYKLYDCVEDVRISGGGCMELFEIDLKYLKLLQEKYEDAICELLSTSRCFSIRNMTLMRLENIEFLLESNLRSQIINQIITTGKHFDSLLEGLVRNGDEKMLTEKVCYLLSYGMKVSTRDLDFLHRYFPNCELFKILLHTDLEISDDSAYDTNFTRLYYDIKIDIENFPVPFRLTFYQADLLLGLCAHQKIKDICSRKCKNILPQIPSLLECARNVFRKYFIEKMKITSARQFYTMVNSLPISTFHKDIITYFRKIYYYPECIKYSGIIYDDRLYRKIRIQRN